MKSLNIMKPGKEIGKKIILINHFLKQQMLQKKFKLTKIREKLNQFNKWYLYVRENKIKI